jgi:dephospho-CoA kinase
VFGSELERQSARQALEQIVHPAIGQLLQAQIQTAQQEAACEVILLDAAILLETGWRQYCNAVVFVDVPETQRLERVKKTRGWTSEEFFARESSQLPVESKRRQSDHVVDNSGPLESAITQLKQICTQIKDDLPQV